MKKFMISMHFFTLFFLCHEMMGAQAFDLERWKRENREEIVRRIENALDRNLQAEAQLMFDLGGTPIDFRNGLLAREIYVNNENEVTRFIKALFDISVLNRRAPKNVEIVRPISPALKSPRRA